MIPAMPELIIRKNRGNIPSNYGGRAFQRCNIRWDTVLLMSGLVLVIIGVYIHLSTAQEVGLVFIGVGAGLCIIKVIYTICTELIQKSVIVEDPQPYSVGINANGEREGGHTNPHPSIQVHLVTRVRVGSAGQKYTPTDL